MFASMIIKKALIAYAIIVTACLAQAQEREHSHLGRRALAPAACKAYTMWWVLFNIPTECESEPCGMPDVMGAIDGPNPSKIAIIYAAGGTTDSDGNLRMTAAIYKTKGKLETGSADQSGPYVWGMSTEIGPKGKSVGFRKGDDTEVHLVVRQHGPCSADADELLAQITRFDDPLCSSLGGTNNCADVAAVIFAADESGTKPAMNVTSLAVDGEFTLLRVGDALQVVANITNIQA